MQKKIARRAYAAVAAAGALWLVGLVAAPLAAQEPLTDVAVRPVLDP